MFLCFRSVGSRNTERESFFSTLLACSLFLGSGSSCAGLGENGLLGQSRRTKHRPKKEPWRVNSLRKRRSFLQTNYTSQVTFPLAPPHTQENTARADDDGEPVLVGPPCSPAVVCSRDPKSDSEAERLEAQRQDQLAKKSAASSDLMERESDSLERMPDSAPHPVSTTQAAQEGRDFSCSSSSTETQDCSLISSPDSDNRPHGLNRSDVSVQAPRTACKGKAEEIAGAAGGIRERCRTSVGHSVNGSPLRAKAIPETGISYVVIEEIIHTTTKPSRSLNGKKLSYEPFLDQDLLSFEVVEKQEHRVLNPCNSEPALCESRQVLGGSLLHENANGMPSEGSSQDSENNQHLGLSNATELLSNSDGTSGIVTRLSWLAFSSMVDHPEMCQQRGDQREATVSQNVPDVNQLSLKDVALHQVLHKRPALPVTSSDVDGGQKLDGDILAGDLLDANYQRPKSRSAVEEEGSKNQRKAIGSIGLDYISVDRVCKAAELAEESRVSHLNAKKTCSDNATEDPTTPNASTQALVNIKETIPSEHNMDRCSCQLTYTSCFSGPDHEAELEYTNPVACGGSEGPLTTPPSTQGPVSLDVNPTGLTQECNSVMNRSARDRGRWLPESHSKTLDHLKDRMCASPLDLCHVLDSVVQLQDILKPFWGSRVTHPREECSAHFSENRNTLYVESQRLASSCQKVTKTQGASSETQSAVRESFQSLLQLTEACLQFTNCGLCSRRHKDLVVNLKDAICSYHQFVQAAEQACEKNYPDLSVKLLVCQYTAFTAALFCLVQQFRTPPCV